MPPSYVQLLREEDIIWAFHTEEKEEEEEEAGEESARGRREGTKGVDCHNDHLCCYRNCFDCLHGSKQKWEDHLTPRILTVYIREE